MPSFTPNKALRVLRDSEFQWSVNEKQAEIRANTICVRLIETGLIEGEVYQGHAIEKGSLKE
jgi:hypothetical protein